MRISFPNKEQDDTLVGFGETRIGAAPDNNIVVGGSGVAPHHLRLKLGERGIELAVLDAQTRTHVNTRPVRERAILRLGDMVSLGSVQFVLKPDRDEDIRTDIPAAAAPIAAADSARTYPPRVLLRGLSGMYFGKIIPLRGKLVVGSGGQTDLHLDQPGVAERHAALELADESIVLRSLDSGTTFVDGVETRNAILHAGDQLCFGRDRFLVEAPGLPQRSCSGIAPTSRGLGSDITQTMRTISPPATDERATEVDGRGADGAGKNDIWWLIAAAALIAGGMALVFLGVL